MVEDSRIVGLARSERPAPAAGAASTASVDAAAPVREHHTIRIIHEINAYVDAAAFFECKLEPNPATNRAVHL